MSESKPCVICDKKLEPVFETWDNMQPLNGCEIKIIGCYGSTKFDLNISTTVFRGVICDNCAEILVAKMELDDGKRPAGTALIADLQSIDLNKLTIKKPAS